MSSEEKEDRTARRFAAVVVGAGVFSLLALAAIGFGALVRLVF